MPTLTQIMHDLRQPFPADMVKWKIQTNPKGDATDALVVAFVDARDVAEWLDLKTGGDWSDVYQQPVTAPNLQTVECKLTVCGVTRCDVGETDGDKDGRWSAKDLWSDAFKRAAVKFGVGAFLYRLPKVRANVTKHGTSYYLTREAEADLTMLTNAILNNVHPVPRFRAIRVNGDYQHPIPTPTQPKHTDGDDDDLFAPHPCTDERKKLLERLNTLLSQVGTEAERTREYGDWSDTRITAFGKQLSKRTAKHVQRV